MTKIGFNVGGNKKAAAKKPSGKRTVQKKGKKPEVKKPSTKAKPKKRRGKLPFLTPEYNTNQEGRPTIFSVDLAELICLEIAISGKGLHRICSDNELLPSVRTVYSWLFQASNKEDQFYKEKGEFLHKYTRAREMQADLYNDETIEIADNNRHDRESFVGINHIQRAKLMCEMRLKVSARLWPKKYGSKVDVTSDGDKVGNVQIFIPDNGRNKKA